MRRRSARTTRPSHAAPTGSMFEALEPRIVLAAISWDGGGADNLWSNPLNWSLNFVPRQVDDVTINIPGVQRQIIADVPVIRVSSLTLYETLVVNSGVSLNVLGAFNLQSNADLRINGLVNWVAGTWETERTVRVNAGGLLNIGSSANPGSGFVTLRSELDNIGRFAWRGGDIAIGAAGSITNRAGKSMDFASPGSITGSGSLTNHGLLRRGGLANNTTTIAVAFQNTDRFFILRGTVQIGQTAASPQAQIGGRLAVLDGTSRFIFTTRVTHAAGVQYTGPGTVLANAGQQTFMGDALLAAKTVTIQGAGGATEVPVRIAASSTIRGGATLRHSIVTLQAPLTLDGTFTLIDTLMTDAGIPAKPVLTLKGTHIASGAALAVNTTVLQGASLEIGRQQIGPNGMVVSGNYTLTNRGTTTYNLGTLTIGPGGTIRNEATGTLTLAGPMVGGGPNSGGILNLGLLRRVIAPNNNVTTTITGPLDNRSIVDVEGVLIISGAVAQLSQPGAGQVAVLSAGHWKVRTMSTLDLPGPIERIGPNAVVDLIGLSNVPDLVGFLRENRGTMLFSGSRPGISGPGPTIVNRGLMQMDGDQFSLQVFTTPVEQMPAGRIVVKNGTLQMHGVSGQTRDFANPGTIIIERGKLTLDLDEGDQQGTFRNTGTLDIRSNGQLLIDGAMQTTGAVITEIGPLFRGHVFMNRALTIGGTLQANYVGAGFTTPHTAVVFVVSAMSVTGSFANFSAAGVPQGMSVSLNTMFGVQVLMQS